MNFRGILAALCGGLLGLLAAAPRTMAADDTIKIGYIDPFSGDAVHRQ
jgi:hypothetical protein